jgi:glycosyltransferase involved in cell wall biosynthesis
MDELANSFSPFGEVIRSRYHNTYDFRARSLAAYFNLLGARRIAREWRRAMVDVVHIHKQNLEDGLDLLRAADRSGLASLATIHITQTARFLGAAFAALRDAIARRALCKYAGMLVTGLAARRRDLLDFLGATPKVRLVPPGVPLFDLSQRAVLRETRRAELGLAPGELLFLATGRMRPLKRPHAFLEEALKIHRALPEARFLWLGDGPLSGEWDAWVARHGLQGVVRRLPWQLDLVPVLFAADAFLYMASFQGWPLALLEAFSAGLPCAVAPNLVQELPFLTPENALTLDQEGTWLEAMRQPARREALGRAGRRLVETELSYAHMAEQYETLYHVARRGSG